MKLNFHNLSRTVCTFGLLMAAALSSQNAKAQVLLNETFSNLNGVFPVGWTRFNVDNLTPNTNVSYVNNAWIVRGDLLVTTDTVAISTSWYTPAGTANDWMFTPAIALPAVGSATLTWDAIAYDASYPDGYEVRIMTAAPTSGNITTSTVLLTVAAEASAITPHSVSLASYAGQTVYIGFRNNSTDQFVLAIDDVRVENFTTTTPEARITAVSPGQYTLIPQSQAASFPLSATVNNSGTGSAAAINLTTKVYKLPNVTTPVFTGTGATTNLAAGATTTINTTLPFTPAAPVTGDYIFESIITGNTGVTSNDTFRYGVSVVPNWYARDFGSPERGIGAGAGTAVIIGNNFQVTASAVLDSVLFFCYPGSVGLNDTVRVRITSTTAGVPSNTGYLGQSAIYRFAVADTAGAVLTLPVTNLTGGALTLTPGTYFVGIEKFTTGDNYGLQCDSFIFTANTVYANLNGGAYSPLNSLLAGFNFTPIVRAFMRSSCAVTSTMSSTNATCTAGSGSATITPAGGTAPYTFVWSNGNTAATANNLVAGNYSVTATDASGCSVSNTVTVGSTTTTITTSTPTTTNSACGGATGSASVNPTNGNAPYSYMWSNGGNTQTISNIAAGSYAVTITDVNGCVGTVSNIVVNNPNAPTANITSFSAVACNGQSTGSATVSGTGGTGAYTFNWSNGRTTAANTGLAAGTYTVTVTDAASCAAVTGVTITEPTALSVATNASATANVSCKSGNNGQAGVTVSGGTSAYAFMWSNNATTAAISGLTAGTYTVTVTDANNCNSTHSITVTEPAVALGVTATASDISCNGAGDGSATASAAGGTSPYSYTWSNGGNGATINNLAVGTYTVTTTDANGCVASTSAVTVTEPTAIATGVTVTDASAFGATDGGVNIAISGGTPTYSYLWSNGATTQDLNNVGAGTYTVTVTDANGCTDVHTANVSQPTSIASLNGNINISVFPNPASDKATLSISLANSSDVTIQITNVTGQVLRVINDANVLNNQYTLNMTEWASGVYFVRVTAGNDTATYRVTKK